MALALAGTLGTARAGGPWPQLAGGGYLKLAEWWTVFDQHFTDSGLLDPNVTTGVFVSSLYGEYGFSDRLTGVVYFPFFIRNYTNNLRSATTGALLTPGEALNAPGDIDLSARYTFMKPGARLPLAATLTLGLPTGKIGGGSLGNLQTGDGEFNQQLQIEAGQGYSLLKQYQLYWSAWAGVNNRTRGYSDEFRYQLEAGLGLAQGRLWVINRLTAIHSLRNGLAPADAAVSVGIFANNTEWVSHSLEVAWKFRPQLGLSAGFATAFSGANVAAAPSFTVGVFWDWD